MDSQCHFKTHQIVCLEQDNFYLYAEVIEEVIKRQMCWVRPLLLVKISPPEPEQFWDLRGGSDLWWPRSLFRLALDTEVINFMTQLYATDETCQDEKLTQELLRDFVNRLWRAHPHLFPSLSR